MVEKQTEHIQVIPFGPRSLNQDLVQDQTLALLSWAPCPHSPPHSFTIEHLREREWVGRGHPLHALALADQ